MKLSPKLVIFDVDSVLVDVHGSFHKSIVDTVRFFTRKRVTFAEIHQWKNLSGYNDDWRLTTDWIASLGPAVPYEEVKAQFQKFYWGTKSKPGNVARERWLVTHKQLERWSRRAELALFTGRTRKELRHTLEGTVAKGIFRRCITIDDVTKGKPSPEGLRLLLDGMRKSDALYLGDNIDDALSAKRAGVPFLGVLPYGSHAHRTRAKSLREFGALEILHSVRDLEKFWA
ncbi:MAG TPA: HAD-IA family hydrolase [Candidatus Acidoferrales bacterium]|nr:HAD-IA family hydrolase [Candidatus Acidoferrales bacterium]